jgi:pSer/pThr/pTyr-binding forkhead associated (FHA) protein
VALILEIVDSRTGEVRSRVRVHSAPVTIGRDYANDVILDDPYVDARHARIAVDDAGATVMEDMGSVNRLVRDGGERVSRVILSPGTEVRVGRTTLRFLDPYAPVPAALPDSTEHARGSRFVEWIMSREGMIATPLLATGVTAFNAWLGSYQRSNAGMIFGLVVALGVGVLLHVSVWSVATRIIRHRFSFFQHLSLASTSYLAATLISTVFRWLEFTFPDGEVIGWVETLAFVILTAATIALHLAWASHLSRRRRWESGIAISVVFFGITGLSALLVEEGVRSLTSLPPFSSSLVPVPVSLVPTGTVAGFIESAADLRDQVDSLAVEKS